MKSFIFIVIIAVVYALPLPTVTVGNFINTPVWYPGDLIDTVSAQWSGGVGILTDRKVPNVVIKNNNGTYRTIVAPFECISRPSSNIPKFITLSNGNIFSCDQTLFELDNNKNNIVNVVQNITFPTSIARIMADNSIVTLVQDADVFTSGKLQTWSKDNSGDWTMKHEQTDLGYGMTYITENIVAIYNKSNNALQILDRQQDNSYLIRRTYTALLSTFADNFPPMVYLNDDTVITGIRDPVLLQPYIFFDKVASGVNLPVKLHQYDGSDSFVFTSQYISDSLDVKPISGLGTSVLAINNDVVVIVAPYDNYNLTRVLKNGSALVLRRQQDNSWKFETKFVQANPEEAQINSVAGYEDGRLYFVACRTAFAEGNRSRARKECGFKYAEWSPPVSQ